MPFSYISPFRFPANILAEQTHRFCVFCCAANIFASPAPLSSYLFYLTPRVWTFSIIPASTSEG